MCSLYFLCLHCFLINIHIFDYPDSRLSGLFTGVPTSPDNRGSTVWGNFSKNLSPKLQKLQNRPARVLTFSNYGCSTSELFENLKWSELVHQRAVSQAIMCIAL